MIFYQWVLVILWVATFLYAVYTDFHGRQPQSAGGFLGFLSSLFFAIGYGLILYAAGAFSMIFGSGE